MHRSAFTRALIAATAVPVMAFAASCSALGGSSDSGDSGSDSAAKPSAESSPSVKPAKFEKLPSACKTLPEKTIKELVPKVKNASGTAVKSADIAVRSGCSWNGLDDNGVKGSQYRYLDVSFQRYESDAALGSGDERAAEVFKKQIALAEDTKDAKGTKTAKTAGIGDEAATVSYELVKDKETYKQQTVVARTANVVVTVNYHGTGFEGAKDPETADMIKNALVALKAAVSAVG